MRIALGTDWMPIFLWAAERRSLADDRLCEQAKVKLHTRQQCVLQNLDFVCITPHNASKPEVDSSTVTFGASDSFAVWQHWNLPRIAGP